METDPNCLLPLPSPLPSVELVRTNGKVLVRVRGVSVTLYDKGDKGAMHCAAVAIAESGEVQSQEVAAAFGISANYLSRLCSRYRREGMAGIVSRPGPKGASKLTDTVRRRIRRLKERGCTHQEIAQRVGVSLGSVSSVLSEARAELQELPFSPSGSPGEREAQDGQEASGRECSEAPAGAFEGTEGGEEEEGLAGEDEPSEVRAPAAEEVESPALLPAVLPEEALAVSFAGGMLLHEPLRRLQLVESFEAAGAQLLGFRRFDLAGTLSALALGFGLGLECVEQFKLLLRADLGLPAGLPLAPELRTLRRKLVELSEATDSVVLMRKLAQAIIQLEPVWGGLYYADGHFTAYHGKLEVPKSRDPRTGRMISGRTDTYVHDVRGRPLFFVSSPVNRQLVSTIPGVLEEIFLVAGENSDVVLMFDRGGWSPKLFAALDDQNVGFATYVKGSPKGYTPPLDSAFQRSWFEFEGKRHTYLTAELELALGDRRYRIIVLKDKDKKIAIVTNMWHEPAAKVVHLLKLRWRQENNFKDLSDNQWIEGIVEYGGEAEPDPTLIPHPERVKLQEELAQVRLDRGELEAQMGRAVQANPERTRPTTRGFKIAHSDLSKRIRELQEREKQLEEAIATLPARIRRCDLNESAMRVVLQTRRRNMVNAVKLAVHNAERWLARKFLAHFDDPDEYRTILRNLLRLPGELHYNPNTREVLVKLRPPDTPKVCNALQKLLSDLNAESPRTLDGRWAIRYTLAS